VRAQDESPLCSRRRALRFDPVQRPAMPAAGSFRRQDRSTGIQHAIYHKCLNSTLNHSVGTTQFHPAPDCGPDLVGLRRTVLPCVSIGTLISLAAPFHWDRQHQQRRPQSSSHAVNQSACSIGIVRHAAWTGACFKSTKSRFRHLPATWRRL